DRTVERRADQLDAGAQDVGEAQEDRQLDAAAGELVDELLHVDRAVAVAARRDDQAALVVDREVAAAPARDVVQVQRVGAGPASEWIVREECSSAGHLLRHAVTAFWPGAQWVIGAVGPDQRGSVARAETKLSWSAPRLAATSRAS